MLPQGATAVFGAESPTLLQQRGDLVDKVVQTMRSQVRHQDESVAGVGLHIAVDLRGDVAGGTDKLLPIGDGDDQFAD